MACYPWTTEFRPWTTTASKLQGEREYYARDHPGSVRDVLDQQGNVTASFDYDPYGKLINSPATLPEFGYAGMQFHAPSGLYLTKYRAYEPQTGRWLSRDPIEEMGGGNLYAYVEGNPVSWDDPLGLSKFDKCMVCQNNFGTGTIEKISVKAILILRKKKQRICTKNGRIWASQGQMVNRRDFLIRIYWNG
ncbi:MAG: RHS repeat-associated core domain-containing protein [Azoarcus sp.]|nr:RHS repeat-associated core domain-containing protein [Azoarcus sp.]